MDYQVEQEEIGLPEIEYDMAKRRAHLTVNAPSVVVFVGVFGGAAALGIWPWTVSLLLAMLLTAVYSLVAINRWQNWLSTHTITREEAELWRRRMGLHVRMRWLAGGILVAAVLWLISLGL